MRKFTCIFSAFTDKSRRACEIADWKSAVTPSESFPSFVIALCTLCAILWIDAPKSLSPPFFYIRYFSIYFIHRGKYIKINFFDGRKLYLSNLFLKVKNHICRIYFDSKKSFLSNLFLTVKNRICQIDFWQSKIDY